MRKVPERYLSFAVQFALACGPCPNSHDIRGTFEQNAPAFFKGCSACAGWAGNTVLLMSNGLRPLRDLSSLFFFVYRTKQRFLQSGYQWKQASSCSTWAWFPRKLMFCTPNSTNKTNSPKSLSLMPQLCLPKSKPLRLRLEKA